MNSAALARLNSLAISETEYSEKKRLFREDREQFFQQVLEHKNYYLYFFYYYSRFAVDLYPLYQERSISDEIYYATFSDLTIWANNCYEQYGEYGIHHYWWLTRHMDLKLFRLGRLQFELSASEWEFEYNNLTINHDTEVISVHIPEGEKLTAELVDDSFRQAFQFWGEDYLYICHTWLLFPELNKILKADSNILAFQNRFQIIQSDYEWREAESRIFNRVLEAIFQYPEKTSLQKSAKEYLLKGNALGRGLGVYKK